MDVVYTVNLDGYDIKGSLLPPVFGPAVRMGIWMAEERQRRQDAEKAILNLADDIGMCVIVEALQALGVLKEASPE